jgi:hypothetical protein
MLKSPNQLVIWEAQQGRNPVVCSSCVMTTTDEATDSLSTAKTASATNSSLETKI